MQQLKVNIWNQNNNNNKDATLNNCNNYYNDYKLIYQL